MPLDVFRDCPELAGKAPLEAGCLFFCAAAAGTMRRGVRDAAIGPLAVAKVAALPRIPQR